MSEKTYVFNDQPNNTGGSRGLDLSLLLNPAGCYGGYPGGCAPAYGGGYGGFGGDGIWAILLLSLLGRGGFGGYGHGGYDGYGYGGSNHIPEILAGDTGRELLMNAIQGNTSAINTLASDLHCSTQDLQNAIYGIDKSIMSVSKEIGMSGMQIINAVNAGDTAIMNQIAQCCCNTQNAITTQGYQNQLATCNQTNTLMNAGCDNTKEIVAKIDAFQTLYTSDKIDALRAQNTRLQAKIDADSAEKCYGQMLNAYTAPINAKLNKIEHEVEEILCHEPPTYPQPYIPGVPLAPRYLYDNHYHGRDRFNDGCCDNHNYNF